MMRFLRGYVAAAIAAAVTFTLVLSALEKETDPGNIAAALPVFGVYSLLFTAVLAPAGMLALRRFGREGTIHFALAGAVLGWLSTLVLIRSPQGLVAPMALAFATAGLVAGLAFRAARGRGRPTRP